MNSDLASLGLVTIRNVGGGWSDIGRLPQSQEPT